MFGFPYNRDNDVFWWNVRVDSRRTPVSTLSTRVWSFWYPFGSDWSYTGRVSRDGNVKDETSYHLRKQLNLPQKIINIVLSQERYRPSYRYLLNLLFPRELYRSAFSFLCHLLLFSNSFLGHEFVLYVQGYTLINWSLGIFSTFPSEIDPPY